jgi:hypothetical protein
MRKGKIFLVMYHPVKKKDNVSLNLGGMNCRKIFLKWNKKGLEKHRRRATEATSGRQAENEAAKPDGVVISSGIDVAITSPCMLLVLYGSILSVFVLSLI